MMKFGNEFGTSQSIEYLPITAAKNSGAELPAAINVAPATSGWI